MTPATHIIAVTINKPKSDVFVISLEVFEGKKKKH